MKKTFSIISLGCPRNLVDSERIVSEFEREGYVLRDQSKGIDTVVINTCAFIEDAKKESIDVILKAIDAKKFGDVKRIVVAGCLPERYARELKKGFRDVDEFRGVLRFESGYFNKGESRLTPGHYAYIKISEGCGNRCSYCVIPYLKGSYRSREIGSVAEEAGKFLDNGTREIILVGQDTSLYGIDLYGREKLAVLLRRLDGISDGKWIRVLYCHPANLGRDVIKVIRDSGNICKCIDLPIEHISDSVLKKMERPVTRRDIASLISYIRREIPGVALRTSVIVGFPGETERDFQELLSFMRETKFERLGIFRYSREEGTAAYKYKGQVSEKEKERRFNEAMTLQQDISKEINERFKGRVLKTLIEERKEDYYIGRTEYDAPEVDGVVYVTGKDLKVGNFYDVRIDDTYEYDLTGTAQGEQTI